MRITHIKLFGKCAERSTLFLSLVGSAIEQDEINGDVVRWLKRLPDGSGEFGSVLHRRMLLARAGLLDGRRANNSLELVFLSHQTAPRRRRSQPMCP